MTKKTNKIESKNDVGEMFKESFDAVFTATVTTAKQTNNDVTFGTAMMAGGFMAAMGTLPGFTNEKAMELVRKWSMEGMVKMYS